VRRLSSRIKPVDQTALTYLEESLETFARGNRVASMVMLGIAAERVFDLVCESLLPAIHSGKERRSLDAAMNRAKIRPRIEFVHRKFTEVEGRSVEGFPESSALMVTALYDMIRLQRNELGHPRPLPPRVEPEEAVSRLHMFAGYYETAEKVRVFLGSHKV
jgi:hypothetical protein